MNPNDSTDSAELKRRIRRLLGVVRSITAHMIVHGQGSEESASHLAGRVSAIGRAALTPPADGTDLESLLLDEFLAYGAQRAPIRLHGPAVRLNAKAAEWLRLAIHELATNSIKFGALSQPEPQLSVAWWISDLPKSLLHIEWSEAGVRMATGAGQSAGFGSEVIKRFIASELRGRGRMQFLSSGILCTIDIPSGEALHAIE
jgi:two-component system CheB/CheR fusion protein